MIKFLDLQKITEKYADEIHAATRRVVDSGWYLQGEENARFETNYARYIGTKHCVGCANGLDALNSGFRSKNFWDSRNIKSHATLMAVFDEFFPAGF